MEYFYVCTPKNTKNPLAIQKNILYNERIVALKGCARYFRCEPSAVYLYFYIPFRMERKEGGKANGCC